MTEQIDEPEVEVEVDEAEPVDEPEVVDESQEGSFDADKAREKIRKLNSEAKNLRDRAKAAEDKAADVGDKDKTISTQADEIVRLKFALEHGLPVALVKRLTGTTDEELLADAEELMDLFGSKKPPTNQPKEKLRSPGGAGASSGSSEDDVEAAVKAAFTR